MPKSDRLEARVYTCIVPIPTLSSLDTERPLHEKRWLDLNRRLDRAWETVDPDDYHAAARRSVHVICCCDDPVCDEQVILSLEEVDGKPCYVAPGHKEVGEVLREINTQGWTVQAPIVDHLGRAAFGLAHPARVQLENMLAKLSASAGVDEPSLMISHAGLEAPPFIDMPTQAITFSTELLDNFAGQIEIFDSILGHEIAHIIQCSEDRSCQGPEAELEADRFGARLSGRRQEKWAIEILYEFWKSRGIPVTSEGSRRYPALSARLDVMDEATRDLPFVDARNALSIEA